MESRRRRRRRVARSFWVNAEESGFDPTQARYDEVGVMYARTVFDPLTIITASGGWAPYLAESVVPNSNYTTLDHHPSTQLGVPRRHLV